MLKNTTDLYLYKLDLHEQINHKVDKIKFKFMFSNIFKELDKITIHITSPIIEPENISCSRHEKLIPPICFRTRNPNHKTVCDLTHHSRSRSIRRKDTHDCEQL